MKYYRSHPHEYLTVLDFVGHLVPNVIEYDDENEMVTMILFTEDGQAILYKDEFGSINPVKVTFKLPGSKIVR